MPFNSLQYFIFFIVVCYASWATVRFPNIRLWLLWGASYYFYAANNHWLVILLLASTQIDYLAALQIESSKEPRVRRFCLIVSLCANLGMLCYFKYWNFFAHNIAAAAANLGYQLSWVDYNIVLPVGISFYTFQSMSYTIDVYRGQLIAERSWLRFSLFVAYFPQLVAGPIVRPSHFLPQLSRTPRLRQADLDRALPLIATGVFKKIVLADFLAQYADALFDSPVGAGAMSAWLGVYAFCFQIYFDFSGYTDIAIGCARLMGFDLPENFNRPYAALCIRDFWRRWHISLSTWLRDYLYVPLGGSRMSSNWGMYRNLMITMLLGGLWHGAAWNFVLWGFLHGSYLVGERIFQIAPSRGELGGFRRLSYQIITLHLVCISWVLFRAEGLAEAAAVFRELVRFESSTAVTWGMVAASVIIAISWLAQLVGLSSEMLEQRTVAMRAAVYAMIVLLVTVLGSQQYQPFIYFQF